MTRKYRVLEKAVCSPFKHLTRLVDRKSFCKNCAGFYFSCCCLFYYYYYYYYYYVVVVVVVVAAKGSVPSVTSDLSDIISKSRNINTFVTIDPQQIFHVVCVAVSRKISHAEVRRFDSYRSPNRKVKYLHYRRVVYLYSIKKYCSFWNVVIVKYASYNGQSVQ